MLTLVMTAPAPGGATTYPAPRIIGVHLPFTGPAPIPSDDIHTAANLYWRWLDEIAGETVHGRSVRAEVRDDQGSPTMAVHACDELAGEGAVMVVGGFDPITTGACSQYAEGATIPYLAFGGSDTPPAATTYRLTATYGTQAPIIAEYIVNELGTEADRYAEPTPSPLSVCGIVETIGIDIAITGCETEPPANGVRIALVRPSGTYADSTEGPLREALRALGTDLHEVFVVDRSGGGGRFNQVAAEMKAARVDLAVLATDPLQTIQLSNALTSMDHQPLLHFFGGTGDVQSVATWGCPWVDAASSFAGRPGTDAMFSGDLDPAFTVAVNEFVSEAVTPEAAEVMAWLWGVMKSAHAIMEAAGPEPDHASIVGTLEAGYAHSTGVLPDFSVNSEDHFGAEQVHRLEVDCEGSGSFEHRDTSVTGYPDEP